MIFLFLIDALLICAGIEHAFRILSVARRLKKKRNDLVISNVSLERYPFLYILIPLLRETAVLDGMCSWLKGLEYPEEKIRFVLITTEREYETAYTPATDTVSAVTKHVHELREGGDKRFLHIHYPKTVGVKSDQLNFALNTLESENLLGLSENTYIGIYDADSLTPKDTLVILATQSAQDNYKNIYQQPTWYFKNHDSLPRNFAGYLVEGFAWLQTAFALCHEAFLLLDQAGKKELTKMEYGVGHGLFVRWPFLKKIGLFPTPIEDTRLGQTASFLGEKLELIPVFDTVEVAMGVRKQIKQFSVWFTGVAFVVEDLKIAKSIARVPRFRAWHLLTHRLYRNAVWICRPFILFAAVFITLITGHTALALIVIASYLYLPVIVLNIQKKQFGEYVGVTEGSVGHAPSFFAFFLMPIEFIIMSLGPLLGLVRFIRFRISGHGLILPKTERQQHD